MNRLEFKNGCMSFSRGFSYPDFQKIPHHNTRNERVLIFPSELNSFAGGFKEKLETGQLLGNDRMQRGSIERGDLRHVRRVAKSNFNNPGFSFEPSKEAREKTIKAAQAFFSLSSKQLHDNNKFPLAGRNKCLGMVVVPKSKLVLIAVSQDKDPKNDVELRKNLLELITKVNGSTKDWVFELTRIPSKSEYILPRSISMRTPHDATHEIVTPRTRCVELALMVALNKAGRSRPFQAEEFSMVAFGGTLWNSEKGGEAAPHFEGAERNLKNVTLDPIAVDLGAGKKGWLDVWDPCSEHCALYLKEMVAIAAAGGPASSFSEPRGEWIPPKSRI